MAEKTDKETWKNAGAGEVWINVIDPHTPETKAHPRTLGCEGASYYRRAPDQSGSCCF